MGEPADSVTRERRRWLLACHQADDTISAICCALGTSEAEAWLLIAAAQKAEPLGFPPGCPNCCEGCQSATGGVCVEHFAEWGDREDVPR